MHEDIYPLLVEVIKDNSSWIRLTDCKRYRKRYVYLDNCMRTKMSRSITFRASIRVGAYSEGHEWNVSEDEIDKAVRQLEAQSPSFATRIADLEMTAKDAQDIIYIASHGILNLNLYDEYNTDSG